MSEQTIGSIQLDGSQPHSPESPRPQSFSEYMSEFLRSIKAHDVVEVGSDVQLRIAARLSPFCDRYYSVNFPADTRRMRGWYELGQGMGSLQNVELIAGNAVQLSGLVPHADLIILHNLLLAASIEDMEFFGQYIRGEIDFSDEDWNRLVRKFNEAEIQGYREFLRVANPGYIAVFRRPDKDNKFFNFLTSSLEIDEKNINRRQLFYDGLEDLWELFIINNNGRI